MKKAPERGDDKDKEYSPKIIHSLETDNRNYTRDQFECLWYIGVYYFVYILASKRNGVLYVGMTNNLSRRLCEHKIGLNNGFSIRYNVSKLVYIEQSRDVRVIIEREKQIKKWRRQWKIDLIDRFNPKWEDLSEKYSVIRYSKNNEF